MRDDRATKIPIHTGFDQDARAVWKDAQPYLKNGYQTYLVGHSLGGAVAAILGIYMIEDGYKVDKIYTYGQPRFTTATGVAQLGFLPLMRVVDENDLVPLLPPGLMVNKKYGPYSRWDRKSSCWRARTMSTCPPGRNRAQPRRVLARPERRRPQGPQAQQLHPADRGQDRRQPPGRL